jgi:hypothetical protein
MYFIWEEGGSNLRASLDFSLEMVRPISFLWLFLLKVNLAHILL